LKAFSKVLFSGVGIVFFMGVSVPVREAGFPDVGVGLFLVGCLCVFLTLMFGSNYIFEGVV